MRRKFGFFVVALVSLIAAVIGPITPAAAFSSSNIISNSVFFNSASLSAGDIANFLSSKGSGYANYTIPQFIDVPYPTGQHTYGHVSVEQAYTGNPRQNFYGLTVAQLIYNKTQQYGINPQLILATLQKESSAVTTNILGSPADAWAMGYGYPDSFNACYNSGSGCSDPGIRQNAIDYGGVGQQIAYATHQFSNLYTRYVGTSLTITVDGQSITCANVPTKVMYAYTPHISGNQSFYNIFNSFFGYTPDAVITYNDIATINGPTYSASVSLSGSKSSDSQVFLGSSLIADTGTTSWTISNRGLNVGNNDLSLAYKVSGSTVASKQIILNRHKLGDINGDGSVNVVDLSIFAKNWQQNNAGDPMSNFNPETDNVVNLVDLSIFAKYWGS
ncbi:MAG TPA: hypothetical protein VLE93_00210 [Candidatus Saccharimonadales bacterium]|nr:hypothetical protein [Candidatus Saccharimonadales bacterium]